MLESLWKYNKDLENERNKDQKLYKKGRGRHSVFLTEDGGISTERLQDNSNKIDLLQIKKHVRNLLKEGKKGEAYSFIFNCGLPPQKKNRLIQLLF